MIRSDAKSARLHPLDHVQLVALERDRVDPERVPIRLPPLLGAKQVLQRGGVRVAAQRRDQPRVGGGILGFQFQLANVGGQPFGRPHPRRLRAAGRLTLDRGRAGSIRPCAEAPQATASTATAQSRASERFTRGIVSRRPSRRQHKSRVLLREFRGRSQMRATARRSAFAHPGRVDRPTESSPSRRCARCGRTGCAASSGEPSPCRRAPISTQPMFFPAPSSRPAGRRLPCRSPDPRPCPGARSGTARQSASCQFLAVWSFLSGVFAAATPIVFGDSRPTDARTPSPCRPTPP